MPIMIRQLRHSWKALKPIQLVQFWEASSKHNIQMSTTESKGCNKGSVEEFNAKPNSRDQGINILPVKPF